MDDDGWFAGDPGDLIDAADAILERLRRPSWHARAACRGMRTTEFFRDTVTDFDTTPDWAARLAIGGGIMLTAVPLAGILAGIGALVQITAAQHD